MREHNGILNGIVKIHTLSFLQLGLCVSKLLESIWEKCTEFPEMFLNFLAVENTHEYLPAQENNLKYILIEMSNLNNLMKKFCQNRAK